MKAAIVTTAIVGSARTIARRALVVSALVLGAIVVASPAGAVTVPPPSLVGEQLFAGADSTGGQGTFLTNFTCNADQSGQITFSANGVAVGPYPGTFVESGSVTVGSSTLPGAGPITTLTTDFEITSGTTIVTGHKTVVVAPTNQGACATFADVGSECLHLAIDVEAEVEDDEHGPDRIFATVLAEVTLVAKNLRRARALTAELLCNPPQVAPDPPS